MMNLQMKLRTNWLLLSPKHEQGVKNTLNSASVSAHRCAYIDDKACNTNHSLKINTTQHTHTLTLTRTHTWTSLWVGEGRGRSSERGKRICWLFRFWRLQIMKQRQNSHKMYSVQWTKNIRLTPMLILLCIRTLYIHMYIDFQIKNTPIRFKN